MAQVEIDGLPGFDGLHLNIPAKRPDGSRVYYHRTARRGGVTFAITPERVTKMTWELVQKLVEAQAAASGAPAPPVRERTLGDLVADWQDSAHWRARLSPSTQSGYERNIAAALEVELPDGGTLAQMPQAALGERGARKILLRVQEVLAQGWRRARRSAELEAAAKHRGRAAPAGPHKPGDVWLQTVTRTNTACMVWGATPARADEAMKALQACLSWAVDQGEIAASEHPLSEYRHVSASNRADRIWRPEKLAALIAACSPPVALAVRLAALTGMAPCDLVAITWAAVTSYGVILPNGRKKTGEAVAVPLYAELRELLDELRARFGGAAPPADAPLLVNSRGAPWTASGLSASFRAIGERAAAGAPDALDAWGRRLGARAAKGASGFDFEGLTFYDLRGTAATHLVGAAKLGAEAVADILGWKPERVRGILKRYVYQPNVMRLRAERIDAAPRITPHLVAQNG